MLDLDSTPPCICIVGRHPSASEISQILREGTATVHQISKRFGPLTPTAISRHRTKCLGLTPKPFIRADTPPRPPAATSRNVPTTLPTDPPNTPESPPRTVASARGYRFAPDEQALSDVTKATTEEEQTRFVSHLIDTNRFHFHATLTWLETEWGISPMDVRHRYEQAVQRCSADRQMALAQLEVTLAALEVKERWAMAEFRRLRTRNIPQARGYLALATKVRTEYADLAGLKTIRIEANVNVWTHPAFVVAVDRFTEAALDVIAPVDEAAAALLERVSARLGRPVDAEVVSAMLAQLQADAAGRFAALTAEAQGTAGETILTQGVSLPEGT